MKPIITIAVVSILGMASAAIAEKPIRKSEMPPTVQKTADEQSAGATVRGYAKDVENGRVEYEVELLVNGHTKDVTMDPQGRVTEIEEQMEMASLPVGVREALQKRATPGKIVKVESLTKHGSLVAYEAQVVKDSRHFEVQVGPQGQTLDHEE
ncbi:MAG: hypothetical protein K6T49_08640 [Acidobacterium ailaaui]|nr:hypothetical protein [Pseudacidobacterium ailaaui]